MSMEYCIQTFDKNPKEWKCGSVTFFSQKDARIFMRHFVDFRSNHRLACREVGDWCECREDAR